MGERKSLWEYDKPWLVEKINEMEKEIHGLQKVQKEHERQLNRWKGSLLALVVIVPFLMEAASTFFPIWRQK